MCRPDLIPENDLFIQHIKLKNTLRLIMGEEVLDHSGLDYYEHEDAVPAQAEPAKPYRKKTKTQLRKKVSLKK